MVKSFLLEIIRFYPSNRSLSYWKLFATIRQIFCFDPVQEKIGRFHNAIALGRTFMVNE